ncbi:MAG: hypothetical protein H7Y15_15965 [Pseudonocardia sp.]|nr:hypothetical protein [Pseudonocardia sp.]
MSDNPSRRAAAREAWLQQLRETTNRPLPPLRVRRRLAVGYLLVVAMMAGSALLGGTAEPWAALAQALGIVVLLGLFIALRRATRLLVDAPTEALDEMLTRIRDQAFIPAYQTLAALVILAAAALILSSAHGLSGPAALAMGWAGFGIALGLPVIIAAWTLPDIDPEA